MSRIKEDICRKNLIKSLKVMNGGNLKIYRNCRSSSRIIGGNHRKFSSSLWNSMRAKLNLWVDELPKEPVLLKVQGLSLKFKIQD